MAFTLAEALQGVAVTFNADGLVGLMHINERGIQSDTPTVILLHFNHPMMEHFKVRTLTLVSDETLTTGASVGKASIDACTTISARIGITVINIINCNKFKIK